MGKSFITLMFLINFKERLVGLGYNFTPKKISEIFGEEISNCIDSLLENVNSDTETTKAVKTYTDSITNDYIKNKLSA